MGGFEMASNKFAMQKLRRKTIYGCSIEAISKIGFWLKVKAGPSFNPQTY